MFIHFRFCIIVLWFISTASYIWIFRESKRDKRIVIIGRKWKGNLLDWWMMLLKLSFHCFVVYIKVFYESESFDKYKKIFVANFLRDERNTDLLKFWVLIKLFFCKFNSVITYFSHRSEQKKLEHVTKFLRRTYFNKRELCIRGYIFFIFYYFTNFLGWALTLTLKKIKIP